MGLKVSERANLKKTTDKNWNRYFGEYLDDIEDCPYQLTSSLSVSDWAEIIEWLVQQSIARTFADNKDEFNRRTPIRRVERREYALSDTLSEQTQTAMAELCRFLRIPAHSDAVITAQTLHNFIKSKFSLSSVTNSEATLDGDATQQRKREKDLLRKQFSSSHDPWRKIESVEDVLRFYG